MIMNNILNKIKESNIIGITFHQSPDGDSIGSATALLQGLRILGKETYIISLEKASETFNFLRCSDEIDGNITDVRKGTDCIIVLDCGDFKRINANLNNNSIKEYTLINIDHHLTNESYGDLNYVDITSSAVGEIVYEMLKKLNITIDKNIASSLYTSLLTDTGSFRHSNTTKITHSIAGELINTGIDFSEIHRIIFDNKKFERIKLYGKVIDTISLNCNKKVCFMKITQKMLQDLNLENSDTSDVITFGTKIDTVEVTVLIKEADEGVKVSLRSKSKVDVRRIAESFNGGGHIRAAGFAVNDTMGSVEKRLIEILEKELV